MNFLRKFMSSTAMDEVALLHLGRLFLARSPQLPKNEFECLYNDALLAIKKAGQPFCYLLSVIKAYLEGETSSQSAGFDDESDGEDSAGSELESCGSDERLFFLCAELGIRVFSKHDGAPVVAWKDLDGDDGDTFEFQIDFEVKNSQVDHFIGAAHKCLFETTYQRSYEGEPLDEFIYDPLRELEIDYMSKLEVGLETLQFHDLSLFPCHLLNSEFPAQVKEADSLWRGSGELRWLDTVRETFQAVLSFSTFLVGDYFGGSHQDLKFCVPRGLLRLEGAHLSFRIDDYTFSLRFAPDKFAELKALLNL